MVNDTTKKTIDSCALKHKLDSIENNTMIMSLTDRIKNSNSSVELGVPVNLNSAFDLTTFRDVSGFTSNNAVNYVNIPFTWNTSFGFTIGTIHLHPGGSAPSYDDILGLIDNLKLLQSTGATAADIAFYKENAFASVVTGIAKYNARITDWDGIMSAYDSWKADPAAFDLEWKRVAGTQLPPSEASLMNTLGNYIAVFKQTQGTPYKPLIINSNGYVQTKALNCP